MWCSRTALVEPISRSSEAGPDGLATEATIREADAALGKLVDGLKQRNLLERTNLIIVADHGMAEISRDRVIELDELLNLDHVRVITEGSLSGLESKPGFGRGVEKALFGRHDHMSCWRKERMPSRFHYGSNARIPPILCLADIGWQIATKATKAKWPGDNRGNHGFDPADPSMAGVFVAYGRAFRSRVTWPKFPNVDVYPLLAKVTKVKPLPNDGRLGRVDTCREDIGNGLRPSHPIGDAAIPYAAAVLQGGYNLK